MPLVAFVAADAAKKLASRGARLHATERACVAGSVRSNQLPHGASATACPAPFALGPLGGIGTGRGNRTWTGTAPDESMRTSLPFVSCVRTCGRSAKGAPARLL